MDSIDGHKYNKRPTQADVARLAEVSQAMVSYVVNDIPSISISDKTRARVLDAVKTLGYVPDSAARSLKTRKSSTIAGIIPDITNPFYPAFQRGIQDIADRHGYDLLACNTDASPEKEARCLLLARQGRVDGLVAVLFHQSAPELLDLLDRGVGIVRLEAERKEPGEWPLDNVFIDNDAAAYMVTTYLICRGHRRIGIIGGSRGPRPARARGYLKAIGDHGISTDESLVREGHFQEWGGRVAMQELLSLRSPPTAVFALNDLMAIGAINAIKAAGMSVPEDVAVVGFDDIPAAQFVSPALTTVAHHPRSIGNRAAEMLVDRLQGTAPSHGRSEEMPFELISRESA